MDQERPFQNLLDSYNRKGPAGHATKVGVETFIGLSVLEGAYKYSRQQRHLAEQEQNYPEQPYEVPRVQIAPGDYGMLPAPRPQQPSLAGSIVSAIFGSGIFAPILGAIIGLLVIVVGIMGLMLMFPAAP